MMSTPDADWLNAQYNNRALVPEHGQHLAHWAKASAEARGALACELDVPYGADASETLDIFPVQRSNHQAPVLIFLHGGYWRSLDKSDHSFIAPAFVQAGVCVVVPNYALCPAVTVTHIGQQMARAVAWVQQHIVEWGGDPQRIVLVGHSAGGQLAALLLAQQSALVRAAVSISGLFDLEPLRHTPFLQEALQLTPDEVRACGPVHHPAPEGRPLWAVVGGCESDEFLRQTQLIQHTWGPSAVPQAIALDGLNHFSILDSLVQTDAPLHRLVRQVLKTT